MMRSKFEEQLEYLNADLIAMGSLCETAICNAAKALLERDIELAKATVRMDEEIDQKEREIEGLCLKLLLRQQPVARDLRQISAALKMITDMERIGDQAADIAEIVTMGEAVDVNDALLLGKMADAAIKMVTESIEAFVRQDIELAKQVIDYDDVVDDYFNQVKQELIQHIAGGEGSGVAAVDVLMIAKYLERIGDHAVNIAEWVEFSITGIHKGGKTV